MLMTRIVTLMTITTSNLKKLNLFFIDILASASLTTKFQKSLILFLWRSFFFTSKKKTIIRECKWHRSFIFSSIIFHVDLHSADSDLKLMFIHSEKFWLLMKKTTICYCFYLIIWYFLRFMMMSLKLSQFNRWWIYFKWKCRWTRKAWYWNESATSWIFQSFVKNYEAWKNSIHRRRILYVLACESNIWSDLKRKQTFNISSLNMNFDVIF